MATLSQHKYVVKEPLGKLLSNMASNQRGTAAKVGSILSPTEKLSSNMAHAFPYNRT